MRRRSWRDRSCTGGGNCACSRCASRSASSRGRCARRCRSADSSSCRRSRTLCSSSGSSSRCSDYRLYPHTTSTAWTLSDTDTAALRRIPSEIRMSLCLHQEPDLEALAQRSVERRERADERHREALRELSSRRQQEEQQQRRHTEARRKALLEEKRRAERVASLPPPRPDPVESIGKKTPRPLRPAAAERFSLTHCHMTAVDRETDPEHQPSAQQAAALEVQRLEELRREEARDRQERLERARLRGNHALRTEQHTQVQPCSGSCAAAL
uniref:Uncharacterized protein n=1 Tax=Cyprinus carpio carpio TaxID=630221 RepID=A0A9J7ZI38_CYPCA